MKNETKIMLLNRTKSNLDKINALVDNALDGKKVAFDQLDELDEIIGNFFDWADSSDPSE